MPRKRKSNLARSSSNARAQRIARRQESEEDTRTRLSLDAERHASRIANETPEQNEARRVLDAERHAARRAAETERKRLARQILDAKRHADLRDAETLEQAQARRRLDAKRHASRRATETPEQYEARRTLDAERHAARKAAQTEGESLARWALETLVQIQVYKLEDDSEDWVQVGELEKLLNPVTSLAEPHSSGEGGSSNGTCKKRKLGNSEVNADILTEQKSLSQTLKDIQSHLHVLTSHNDDYHDTFGKYIASLLRSLPPQKALALQPKIVSLITEAEKDSGEENDNGEEQPEADEFDNIVIKVDRDDDDDE